MLEEALPDEEVLLESGGRQEPDLEADEDSDKSPPPASNMRSDLKALHRDRPIPLLVRQRFMADQDLVLLQAITSRDICFSRTWC